MEKEKFKKLTFDVGIARRVGKQDEAFLAEFNPMNPFHLVRAAEMAKSIGGGVQANDLLGAAGVSKRLQMAQEAAVRRADAAPLDLTRSILKEYGFQTGDLPTAFEQEFSKELGGTASRGMAQRIISSQQTIAGIAKRKAGGEGGLSGVDAMATEYFKAVKSGKSKDMEAFRKQYGLYDTDSHGMLTGRSVEDFSQFEQAMQFQQQTGLLGFGNSGNRNADQAGLKRLFSAAMQTGEGRGSGSNQAYRTEMFGTVKIDLVNGEMDMSGAHGRAFTAPGG